MFNNIYKNRRVLVTGHAGFKGSWLTLWLKQMGAEVFGYSLIPDTEETAYEAMGISQIIDAQEIADIRDTKTLEEFFQKTKPEIVMHLAAQPLVRLSYHEPKLTYETNVIGTLNVLEAARKTKSVKAFVNVTTDKCYENTEQKYRYCETDPMGGYDIYSSSKGCSEILTSSYRRSFLSESDTYFLASARAGNVIGGGDWAADRLIPDCIRFLVKKQPIFIRNPDSVRPWQHVLEPLSGYLRLGQKLFETPQNCSYCFNFGPDSFAELRVEDLAKIMVEVWGEGKIEKIKSDTLHEAKLLMLDIKKAETELDVRPVMDARDAVAMTANWYKNFYYNNSDMREFSTAQIFEFAKKAKAKKILWSI